MTSRQRELYLRMRSRVGRLRARMVRRPAPETPDVGSAPPRIPGRAPKVVRETTHFGPVMDEAVFRAKRRLRIGADPDYDRVYEHFDVLHYLLQVPRALERQRLDLIQHFLDTGVKDLRSPEPNFSMESYLQRYPEKAGGDERSPYLEWLKRGRAAGELADPAPAIPGMAHLLGLAPEAVVELLSVQRADLIERLRTGELGEMVARATEIEPLIARARSRFTRPRLLPFGHPPAVEQAAVIHAAHEAAGFRTARLVLVINRPRWGGGRRMEGHLAHAFASRVKPDDVVVIYTDGGGHTPGGRFPAGVRELDFAGLAARLEPEDAEMALVVLLRTFRADAIVNINSAMLYHAMRSLGRALTASERVFLCFFCNEQTPTGAWTGWSMRYFYRLFPHVTGVVTDSNHLAQQLQQAHHIPSSDRHRLQVLRAPVDSELPFVAEAPTAPGRRPQVFWAGRWDRQKRIDLFLQVARQMPDVDFRMWGEAVMSGGGRKIPPNVTMQGRYSHIAEISLDEADAWLYTSAWDGVPSQLLEVGMTGVPIVGTVVGGTGEVLAPEDAWPVGEHEGADSYVRALRSVLADPIEARQKAGDLRKRLLAERTEEAFQDHALQLLLRTPTEHESSPR